MIRGTFVRFCTKPRAKAFVTLLLLLYSLLRVSSLCAQEEKVLVIGASSGWSAAETRVQVTEIPALRPFPVLALSSAWTGEPGRGAAESAAFENAVFSNAARQDILALYEAYRNFPADESAMDLALSFDQSRPADYRDAAGRYRVEVSPALQAAAGRWARYGSGAALFTGVGTREEGAPLRISPERGLFSPGRGMRDFSIEFWLYPNNLENGEQLLAWTAVLPGKTETIQRIFCETVRNRIRWTFHNFFTAPGGPDPALSISFETRKSLVPRTWTHHLVRYDADTGLLEYLVNGEPENAAYTTLSGREGGDVYTPYPGRDGFFVLGGRYSGLMDEFRIYREAAGVPGRGFPAAAGRGSPELPDLAKFPQSGGRFETRTLDLGEPGTTVLRLEASGGRYTAGSAGRRPIRNSYEGKSNFRFADDSAVQFFFRAGEEPYRFENSPWVPVTPGTALTGIRGRYLQLAAAFYPSGDCETGPYLEEIRVVYESNEAPYPPSLVTARALDGAVELNWRPSPDSDTAGYVVYYGTSGGVYYGEGAIQGGSPIDVGRRTSLRLDGLKNGVLYFFAVAAYDGSGVPHVGTFSKEVTARPLRTNE
jgi:hypothetical protein